MTLCNLTIEARRAGRPGGAGRDHLRLPEGPAGHAEGRRLGDGAALLEDASSPTTDAVFDREIMLDAAKIAPLVTWGTSPEDVLRDHRHACPTRRASRRPDKRASAERALDYMGLDRRPADHRGQDRRGVHRLLHQQPHRGPARRRQDRARAARSPPHVRAMVVPGSGLVQAQAEDEGLDEIFLAAGFEWREPGCSMCLAHEPRQAAAGPALRLHLQPQLRGPPGPRRPHPPDEPGHGRRRRHRRPHRRRAGLSCDHRPRPRRRSRSATSTPRSTAIAACSGREPDWRPRRRRAPGLVPASQHGAGRHRARRRRRVRRPAARPPGRARRGHLGRWPSRPTTSTAVAGC